MFFITLCFFVYFIYTYFAPHPSQSRWPLSNLWNDYCRFCFLMASSALHGSSFVLYWRRSWESRSEWMNLLCRKTEKKNRVYKTEFVILFLYFIFRLSKKCWILTPPQVDQITLWHLNFHLFCMTVFLRMLIGYMIQVSKCYY